VWSTTNGSIHLEPLWTEVIGVAENVRSAHLGEEDIETVYLPYDLYAVAELSLLVRSRADPLSLTDPIRHEIEQIDAEMAVSNFRLLKDYVSDSVAPQSFSLSLLGTFGLSGLALALMGLYGVLSQSVILRRRELSIRMAFGARPRDVLRLAMRRGLRLTGAGLAIGVAGAFMLTRLLQSQLYAVKPTDPFVFVSVSALISLVGLAACYLPARRATRADPLTILRSE